MTCLLPALRTMTRNHFTHGAINAKLHMTTQTPTRQMLLTFCHSDWVGHWALPKIEAVQE